MLRQKNGGVPMEKSQISAKNRDFPRKNRKNGRFFAVAVTAVSLAHSAFSAFFHLAHFFHLAPFSAKVR